MSKTWYPIINNVKCDGCLLCWHMCKHGVFSLKNGRPVVFFPDGCVTGCHGCEKNCPQQAITYFGDNPIFIIP
ncbi:MAG: 4Fe-4S dicluster domain-containing protein [Bacilli bacterium]|nr:4Fe-4S dicluster domain-containing protein [Bacilli bacterium]